MSQHPWFSSLSLAAFAFSLSTFAATRADEPTGSELRPSGQNQIEVVIPAVDGVVRWKDVASSLSDALKLDAETMQKILPSGELDLRSDTVRLVLAGINLASQDGISFAIVRDSQNRPALSVRCNRKALGQGRHGEEALRRAARIEIDEDWKQRSANRPLVICIHGLQGRPDVFKEFRLFLRGYGFATAAVAYDHEQSIVESAEQLSSIAVQLFGSSASAPSLALVGHSMGGLVAREWTENDALDHQRIVALITIGTPHRGSNWASLPPLLDLFTSGRFDANDLVDVLLHQPSAPGLRELIPDSDFLERLASRPRRSGVAYTTIVGTGSPIEESQVRRLRNILRHLDENGGAVRLIRPRIEPLLESFDELARGKGDGVVAARRATIEGTGDVVQVDLSHFQLIRPIPSGGNHPVWQTVLQRLSSVSLRRNNSQSHPSKTTTFCCRELQPSAAGRATGGLAAAFSTDRTLESASSCGYDWLPCHQ